MPTCKYCLAIPYKTDCPSFKKHVKQCKQDFLEKHGDAQITHVELLKARLKAESRRLEAEIIQSAKQRVDDCDTAKLNNMFGNISTYDKNDWVIHKFRTADELAKRSPNSSEITTFMNSVVFSPGFIDRLQNINHEDHIRTKDFLHDLIYIFEVRLTDTKLITTARGFNRLIAYDDVIMQPAKRRRTEM